MRAIRVVWADRESGEVFKDVTVPTTGEISEVGDGVEIHGFGTTKLDVTFHFDPPIPA